MSEERKRVQLEVWAQCHKAGHKNWPKPPYIKIEHPTQETQADRPVGWSCLRVTLESYAETTQRRRRGGNA